MRRFNLSIGVTLLALSGTARAATFTFDTPPFAGSTALTTPGRQVVGGEPFITFNIASDVFVINQDIFGVGNQELFANGLIASIPASGVNIVVLRTFDDDNNTATAFGAGSAANLIAAQITAPGPGFFIYFNSGLDLPRLVFSTDLNDNTADLKIVARLTNLGGQQGRDAMANFTAANFDFAVPEPSTFGMMAAAGVLWAGMALRRRARG
ncbi:MAG: PEP-CTERM sorting domain-containing protein [Bryobacteraceae bacterium]|nr:PEP-CTERM sorting domain-containing protein [Bryobacteraceae bacterium]